MLNLEKSLAAFNEAKTLMPGGVNSPVRSYANVDCNPPFIAKAKGDRIFDIDGNEYIDYVGSWGPMVVGHAHPNVVKALQEAATRGTSYGAPTLLESELAKLVMQVYPSIEVIRMVNSGTEATMSALRLARGYTGREKIVKFIGCYHGHSDSLLVNAGSGMATFGVPSSPGVTKGTAADTISVPYNDVEAITKVMDEMGDEIAAVIIEPVAGNMGCVPPKQGYLRKIRELTQAHGTILIFDEVMCGFRASLGGAQAAYGITPDLTCLGKIIGGGMPVGAYAGSRALMEQVAPTGPVYQAGTLSGNPVAMAAGLAQLNIITDHPEIYTVMETSASYIANHLRASAEKHGIAMQVNQIGSLLCPYFTETPVNCYAAAKKSDTKRYAAYFNGMLKRGIYLAPSQFEAMFVSSVHTQNDLACTVQAAEETLSEMA